MSFNEIYKNKSKLISVLSIPFWFILFPHTFWFMKIWASLATASLLFVWIDYFKVHRNKNYVLFAGKSYSKRQYYKAMFGTLIFGSVSLGLMAPDMFFQELKLIHIA